ncbi:MAG: two-component system, chemotaxis family, CheB/CheR fusion protein, partial [Campylobacterota bacterium]|nr:two-component system, chemotaxis family, CheB/CheR fusion protein [Campylobacterota bacterium]
KKDDKKIVISLHEDENKKSVLEIFNNAEPIPQDIINKIFDPYFSTKLAKNGTGLGLFTSKNFIEIKMGGKLIAQNKSNGVSFKIVI